MENSDSVPSKEKKPKQDSHSSFENKSSDLFHQSINKYFKNVSINTATYLQSISDLQQEIIKSRKKNAESAILLQKILAEKINSDVEIPQKSLNIINDFTEQTNKAWNFQNQLLVKSIESLSKNIRAFNENADAQIEMNKKMIESWISIIKEEKKLKYK
jgi:hypothetical protein